MVQLKAQDDLDRAVTILTARCPDLARAHQVTGFPAIRQRSADFEGLATIVVAQQVSTASARSIWQRIKDELGSVTPEAIMRRDDDALRTLGLSKPKVRTLRCAAQAAQSGEVDFGMLERLPSDDVHQCLTAVTGIGPWTADIYLLFCLGRADIWPAGDLALMEAIRHLRDLDTVPEGDDRIRHADAWHPYRGAAALLLWAYYGAIKRPGTLA
ncbi:MAG: DNA-3-methyladenine glycosylase 2 family protein [Pseudomonadota bacterium]